MNEEIFRICKICLAVNLQIFVINIKQQALYKNIICAHFDFDLVDVGVEFGACYICYKQLLKILKFSELAQTSGKRLQYLKDIGAKISKRNIGSDNEHSQHNLSITVIPSISLQSIAKITEGTVLNYPVVSVKNKYIEHKHNTDDDRQKSNNYVINHPRPTLPLATISLTQRPMQTETVVGTKTLQEKCTLNKPIDEYFKSNPVNVNEEYIELDHNIADDPYIYNILTVQPSTKSLLKSSIRTETFTGTNNIQEYTLSKQITEDHVVSGEKHNEHNIGDNCEKSKACVNDHTPSMSPANSSSQSLKQTKPLVGTKRKTLDLRSFRKLKKGKTNASELKLENDIAVTNTPFERNDRELAVTNKINQTKNKIEELIQKLIEIHMEAMKKNKNVSSQKQPTWCDRSQLLLIQLIQQAGSEWAGSMLLAGRVFPLFPQGFLRVPSLTELIRMAGYKTNTGPSELYLKQRKDHKVLKSKKSTSVNSVSKKLSTSIDNQGHSVLFSQLTKFPLSNVLEMESKRDIQSFIPVKITLSDTLLTSKESGMSASDSKQPATAVNETNNEIKLNNTVSSSVPKETSSMNKSQEQIAVKFDNHNEIEQNNAIFFRTHQNASKSLQSTISSLVLKETSNISKSQKQNAVNIENHRRISSKRIIKEQLKSTETPKQALKDDMKTIAVPKETDSVLEAMLNKLSKFKKKLDSQNRDYNRDFSSDIEIIENN